MAHLKGNNIIVMVGNNAIAAAKSCEVEMSTELIEVSSPSSGTARSYVAGKTEWKVNVNRLLADTSVMYQAVLQVGTSVTLKVQVRNKSSDYLTGTAIVKSVKMTASRGDLVKFAISFVGTSELT